MKHLLLLSFIVITVAFESCKKHDPEPPKLTAISLSKDTTSLNVGDSKSIAFTLTPSDFDKTQLVWHSSDNSILSVDNTGKITGLREGVAVITITNQTATITTVCLVYVLPQLKAIKMVKDTLQMHAGDVKAVNLILTPENSDKSTLVWKSSDTTILTVSSLGIITAKNEGQAIVSVTSQDGALIAFCLVSVAPKIDDLANGLIAYYPFNDSGLDASGNGNDGTLYNISSVPDRFGKANNAYHFDGYTSYITVPDKPSLRLANTDFTVNAWVKLEVNNSYYGSVIIGKRLTGGGNGWSMMVGGYAQSPIGTIVFGPGGGSNNAFGTRVVTLNQWEMVTCIYKAATMQLSIYVNGVLDNTTSSILPSNPLTNTLMYIGKDDPSVPANGYFFQGSLDEIRMYNRAISSDELQKLYTATQ